MPLYVSLGKFTDQGRKTIKDSPSRFREAVSILGKSGIKVHQALYVTGQYDVVVITEAPNDEAALASGLGTAAQGNIYFETLHAYTVEDVAKVVSKIP